MKAFGHYLPVRIKFGWGRVAEAGEAARALGKRAFIMTGRSSAKKSGALDRVLDSLAESGVEAFVFDGVEEDPSFDTVERAADMFRGEGCDFVISLGGGSSIDAAKAMAASVTSFSPIAELMGVDKVPLPAIPHLAIPTTAGTGSEVTRYSIITDHDAGAKKAMSSEFIYPTAAIIDPELTLTMPPGVTANTGMDALSHAIEGFVSKNWTPVTDALALDAITLVGKHLVTAFEKPEDREAREGMLLASMLGGMVITHAGTGLMHGMGYALTLDYGKAHGLANTMLMGPVMDFSLESDPTKFAMIAAALGRRIGGMTVRDAAGESVAAVKDLAAALGLESNPSGLNIPDEKLGPFADAVMANQRILANVPRTPAREDVMALYRSNI